jgi:hypothetical protein
VKFLSAGDCQLLVEIFALWICLHLDKCLIEFRIVFWDLLPCKIIIDRRFRGTCCLHHQGWATASLMMKAARTSETSVDNYFTRQYIPEDNSELHTRRRENLKSHKWLISGIHKPTVLHTCHEVRTLQLKSHWSDLCESESDLRVTLCYFFDRIGSITAPEVRIYIVSKAVPWLRSLVTGISPRRDLWWTKWHWDRFFSEFFGFPLSISFHRRSPNSYHLWNQ